ncbi:MAG: hypothetical protein COX57_05180 [Alphaproteobacteria bacterium CG_4_10_14_0_2_um_filter_63_37]|nr:MAG: hypothetical protein COX57_05180 [Alphaproteobacteria bacterium CG_4_10_14_0_2_um_filter_63_37]
MAQPTKRMNPNLILIPAGLGIGFFLNRILDRLLGVHLELWQGLSTISLAWLIDLVVIPLLVGAVTAYVIGRSGKWWCMLPVVWVRTLNYIGLSTTGWPEGSSLLPYGFWGFILFTVAECAMLGGYIGEYMRHRYNYYEPVTLMQNPGQKDLFDKQFEREEQK